jgi:5-methylcytosine-specific restriction endonuclease McrA
MSKAWARGSDRAWRRTRAGVLARDGYVCQLKLDGCTGRATHVHHTVSRLAGGDDPLLLVASCAHCNLKTGEPRGNPKPIARTRW